MSDESGLRSSPVRLVVTLTICISFLSNFSQFQRIFLIHRKFVHVWNVCSLCIAYACNIKAHSISYMGKRVAMRTHRYVPRKSCSWSCNKRLPFRCEFAGCTVSPMSAVHYFYRVAVQKRMTFWTSIQKLYISSA